jgi:hypothetical protein
MLRMARPHRVAQPCQHLMLDLCFETRGSAGIGASYLQRFDVVGYRVQGARCKVWGLELGFRESNLRSLRFLE